MNNSRLVYEDDEEENLNDHNKDSDNNNEIIDLVDEQISNINQNNNIWNIVDLEKRGRGRGTLNRFIITWSMRTFNLIDQTLIYYDNNIEKGCIDIKNSKTNAITNPAEADRKPFAFVINLTSGEKIYLNANNDESRQHCINVLNFSANHSIDRISDLQDNEYINNNNNINNTDDNEDPNTNIYDEDINLITTYFQEGTLGVILRRRVEDGIAYIAEVAANSQAMDLDVTVNDELWGIGDHIIGKKYLDKETWKELVELIKNNPRPLKLIWRRYYNVMYHSQSIDELNSIEDIPITIITDINNFIDKEEKEVVNEHTQHNDEGECSLNNIENDVSDEYNKLETLLKTLVKKNKDNSTDKVQDYMYLLKESRIILKRGDLINPSDGNLTIWNTNSIFNTSKNQLKKHVILLSDLLIITSPIIQSSNSIASNFLPMVVLNLPQRSNNNIHQEKFYLVENIIDLQVCKLRSDAHVFGCGENTMVGSNQVANIVKNSDDAENFFQILWPGGVLQFIAENKPTKEIWVLNLFIAICDRVSKEDQVLGWRHQYMLGTMHSAVLSRDEMKVRELIEMCENGNMDFTLSIDAFDEDGYTPLHYACMLRMSGIIRALHEATADVTATDRLGLTPLHWAAMQLDDTSLALLCAHVFDIDYYDNEGRTPLYMACVEGRDIFGKTDVVALSKCITCMLNHQPNINIFDNAGFGIIHHIAASWQYDALDLLLEAGANVNVKCSNHNMTALHLAVMASPMKSYIGEGTRIIFRVTEDSFVDQNNVSKRFEDINKPYGSLTLRTLLKHGMKPNIKDSDGKTALQLLIEKSQLWDNDELYDAVVILISFGARIDDTNTLNNFKIKLQPSINIDALIDKWNSLPVVNGDALELGLNCFKYIEPMDINQSNKSIRNSLSDVSIIDTSLDKCHLCNISFSLFRRQHHCRLCNALCCDDCSKKRVIVLDNSNRTCDSCFNRAMYKLELKNHEEILSRMTVLPKYNNRTTTATSSNCTNNNLIIDIKEDKKQLFGNAVQINNNNESNSNKSTNISVGKSMNTLNETHNKLLERGEKISKLHIKSEEMANQANEFSKLAKQLAEQQKSRGWF